MSVPNTLTANRGPTPLLSPPRITSVVPKKTTLHWTKTTMARGGFRTIRVCYNARNQQIACRRGTGSFSRAALVVIIVSIVTAIALAFSIWYLLNRRKANKAREANPNNCKPDTEKSPNGLSYTHSADVNNAPSVQYNLLEHADYQPRPESYQPQPPPLSYQPNVIQGYNQAGSPRSFEAPAPGSGYNAGYGQN